MHAFGPLLAFQYAACLILIDFLTIMRAGFEDRLHPPSHGTSFRETLDAARWAYVCGMGARSFLWYGERYYIVPDEDEQQLRAEGARNGGETGTH